MDKWLNNAAEKLESVTDDCLVSWPQSIVSQFVQLRKLACEENLYGVLLQTKDLFEEIIKLPTIMALIVLDNAEESGKSDEYMDVIQKLLSQPMTMGAWYSLAMHIVRRRKELSIPESLAAILKKTTLLFQQPITDQISDIVNWRNNSIGHGALRFSDSVSYREEIEHIFSLLSEYIAGESRFSVNALYSHIALRMDSPGDCLVLDEKTYNYGHFAAETDARTYLFESYYSNKKMTKYQSETGNYFSRRMQYFDDLYQTCFRQNKSEEKIRANFVTRENDMLLEYLYNPEVYIKPKYIVDALQDAMEELGKGVILIRMERGMGKTALASRMDGLYTSRKECLIPEAVVRCYHVSNCDLKGIEDYYHSFNFSFKHSYSHVEDIRESDAESVDIVRSSPTAASDVAEALKKYHEWYGREYTVFVIDGIDEMSEVSEEIFSTVPQSNQMAVGTFVILLSRFEDEKTVDKVSNRYIQNAVSLAGRIIDVRRRTPEYIALLKQYVYSCDSSYSDEAATRIIEKADYRMLFIKPYMVLPEATVNVDDETDLIRNYFDRLSMYLNDKQQMMLAKLSVVIALLHTVSIEEMNEYLDCFEPTYQNIGLLNDLKPLMTISHIHGKTYYSFANIAYEKYILSHYNNSLCVILKGILDYIVNDTQSFRKPNKSISLYKKKHFEKVFPFIVEKDEDTIRNTIYKRYYYYSSIIAIVYRFAESNEALWTTITEAAYVDKLIVFLGLSRTDCSDLFGFDTVGAANDPYEYVRAVLIRYIQGNLPEYIMGSINQYVEYLMENYQILHKENNGTRYGLSNDHVYVHTFKKGLEEKRDLSYVFWLISIQFLNEKERDIWSLMRESGQLSGYVNFCIRHIEWSVSVRPPYYREIQLNDMLEHGIVLDLDLEERAINAVLNVYLGRTMEAIKSAEKEEPGSFARVMVDYEKRDVLKSYRMLVNHGLIISEKNKELLQFVYPEIDNEVDEEKAEMRLCEKVRGCLLNWETIDEESCSIVADFISRYLPIQGKKGQSVSEQGKAVLVLIYEKASECLSHGTIYAFAERSGLYNRVTLPGFLSLCLEQHIIALEKEEWIRWLRILINNHGICKQYRDGVVSLRDLLISIQSANVFDDNDQAWLQIMERWVLVYELYSDFGLFGFGGEETKEKLIGRVYCTNNAIRMAHLYLQDGSNTVKAHELLNRMKVDIPYVLDLYDQDSEELKCIFNKQIIRLCHLLEKSGCQDISEDFRAMIRVDYSPRVLLDIIKDIDNYHNASLLRYPVTCVFEYYYEMEDYQGAILLCDEAIDKLVQNKSEEQLQNSIAQELNVALKLYRSLFQYISGSKTKQQLAMDDNMDLEKGKSLILPFGVLSREDGMIAAIFYYRFDLLKPEEYLLEPGEYRNDYLKMFFAGNGDDEIGPRREYPYA